MNEKSHGLEFAYRMLFVVGPAAHKKKSGNYVAEFRFPVMVPALDENGKPHEDDDGRPIFVESKVYRTVFVSKEKIAEVSPSSDESLYLLVEHACLIAIEIMKPFMTNSLAAEVKKFILTPLASAIFLPEAIEQMATFFGIALDEMLIKVNCSAQSSGYLLEHSDVNCAVACALFGTKDMENSDKRYRICERTMKGYMRNGAQYDVVSMTVYAMFTMGGYFDEGSKRALDRLNEQFHCAGTGSACDTQQMSVRLMKYMSSKGCTNPPELLKWFGFDADLTKLCNDNGIAVDDTKCIATDWGHLSEQLGRYFIKPNIEKLLSFVMTMHEKIQALRSQ